MGFITYEDISGDNSGKKRDKKNKSNHHDNRDNENRNRDNRNNDYNKGRDYNKNRDNRNDNNNRNRDNRDNFRFSNPLAKIFNERGASARRYTSKEIRKKVGVDEVIQMIEDIKDWKKNNKRRPEYALNAIRDIMFASCIEKVLKEIDKEKMVKRKDMDYFLDEVLIFLNSLSNEKFDKSIYTNEIIEIMEKIYNSILYKYNKKKINKLLKDVPGISEEAAKKIAILTASKNVDTTIYTLLNKFYYGQISKSTEPFMTNSKSLWKMLKICYGKDNSDRILLFLLLEHNKKYKFTTPTQNNIWATLDEMMLTELEKLSKSDIKKILEKFCDTRHRQEFKNKNPNDKHQTGRIDRRLGNRKAINPDDYPKLTEVFDDYESKDISTSSLYFR